MKKAFFAALLAVGTLFSLSSLLNSCNTANANGTTDVVTGTQPVNIDSWRSALVQQLQSAATDAEREQIMATNGQRLTTQLVDFLRRSGYQCKIDTITYHYGTGTADSVTSGDGNRYTGTFEKQPYAVVKGDACFKKGLCVFILCFNGTFSLQGESRQIGGSAPLVFTIAKNQGINRYIVDFKTSVRIADRFGIPIYEGPGWKKQISLERAIALEPYLKDTLVTVGVFAGDHFDLGADTYNDEGPINR